MTKVPSFAAVVVAVLATAGWALPDFLDVFTARYDAASTKLNSCALCHSVATGLNPYGFAVESELGNKGDDLQAALTAIESRDSDGDGYSNLDEIQARTWPGDPNDSPRVSVNTAAWTAIKLKYRPSRRRVHRPARADQP